MSDHKRYYGFNFLWMFARYRPEMLPQPPALAELDFLAKHGFNFVRVPMDYRFWTKGFDYHNPDERVFEDFIDKYLEECTKRSLHMCLNVHRAPGYCINGNDLEKHNKLSFDLLNEPPNIGQYGCDRAVHEKLMRPSSPLYVPLTPHVKLCWTV